MSPKEHKQDRDIAYLLGMLIRPRGRADMDEVWDTVRNDSPPLVSALEKIIPPETWGDV